MKDKKARKHPWRDNIETLVGAIVLAMIFKAFLLEISRIPSPSMQPTMMGMPENGLSDRVVVDKFSFHLRDPKRWEIVVFKHPIERSRNMVKRLVGMPGEEIRMENGDLWVRSSETEEWKIPFRPKPVQDEMWKAIDLDEPELSSWRAQSGGESWKMTGREILARKDGTARFRPEKDSIYNAYFDGYPDAVRASTGARFSTKPVGDLRFEAEVTALPDCRKVIAILSEGESEYRYILPGPGADSSAKPRIEVHARADASKAQVTTDGTPLATVEGEEWQLSAGSSIRFAAQNFDDRLTLEIDGEWLCELDIAAVANQSSAVDLRVVGEGADFADVQVSRDVYYLKGLTVGESTPIPLGHYFMMGDNTQASADSREWVAASYEWKTEDGETRTMKGNYRPQGENPAPGVDRDGEPAQFFRDEWGERHQLEKSARQTGRLRQPTVPRALIRGRALAVFWPMKPSMGIWRLGWLH